MSTNLIRGNINRMMLVQASYDPASVAANTTADNSTTITVPGARVGDLVIAFKPTTEAGLAVVDARVSAANTVQVVFGNFTGGGIDEGAETWTFLIIRPDVATLPGDAL
jgi:hypothetical protein